MKYPSAWYIGDKAIVRSGRHKHRVRIEGFRDHLVLLEYPNGHRGMRPFSALEPIEEVEALSYCSLPTDQAA